MPGLSVVAGRGSLSRDAVDAAFDAVMFDDGYAHERLYDGEDLLVGRSGYPSYPLTRLETDRWHVFLDGVLYDHSTDDRGESLARVADLLASDHGELASWLRTRDGEFLLVAVDRATEEAYVLTDAFARLPAYRASVDGADVVSREPAFVGTLARRAGADPTMDRLAVAQTLLFGHPLGDRTLHEGVSRLPPATRVRLGGERECALRHDFGERAYADRSVEENAGRLARRFVVACENRAANGPVVVSLDGGLDSRAVAAGYAGVDVPTTTATPDPVERDERTAVRVAERVAEVVGLPWKRYRVASAAAHESWLLDAMWGTDSVESAFVVGFLDTLVDDHGRGVTLATGDGGIAALSALTPQRSFDDVDGVVDHLVDRAAGMTLPDAAAAAGVDASRLRSSVVERVDGYPESSLGDRCAHFRVRERGANRIAVRADRNRHVCWSVAPFYAAPVLLDAMNCPPEQKRRDRLYRAFLRALSPGVERVGDGAEPDSRAHVLGRLVPDLVARRSSPGWSPTDTAPDRTPDEESVRRLRTALATCDRVGRVLSTDAVGRALDDGRVPRTAAYDLLTVVALVGRRTTVAPEA